MSAPRRRSRLFTTSAFGALALAALWAAPAQAQLVQGASPAQSNGAGPAIDQSVANTTTVTLGGSRTVIDWDKFDINNGDTANFVFANRSDIVLNRVGGAGSTINGNLNGTIGSAGGATGGNIWIYNANGVVIGANARISTGGLLVTTAALDRATDSSAGGFLDGNSTSFGFTGAASGTGITVQNGAQITSHGGAIALIAPMVTTEAGSSISAQDGGNVLVGAAAKYQISFRQTGADDLDLMSFEVADGADGTEETGGLTLGGAISGNRVFAAVVSKTGVVSSILVNGSLAANSVAQDENGAIVLTTQHNVVNGAADASAVAGSGDGNVAGIGGSNLAGPDISVLARDAFIYNGGISAAGGTVDLNAERGRIAAGNSLISAGTLTASTAQTLALNNAGNQIQNLGGLTAGSDINVGNAIDIHVTGDISGPDVTLTGPGISQAAGTSIVANNLTLNAVSGAIDQDASASVHVGNYLEGHANTDLLLRGANDLGFQDPYLTAGVGKDVTIRSVGDIRYNSYGIPVGTLTLISDAGSIRQGSGINATTLIAQAATGLRLDGGGVGNAVTTVAGLSTASGDIVFTEGDGFDLVGDISGPGLVQFGTNGAITWSAGQLSAGTLEVTAGGGATFDVAGDIKLGAVSTSGGGDFYLGSNGNIDVTGAVSTGGRDLTLYTSDGAITTHGGTISTGVGIGVANVTAKGGITLVGAGFANFWATSTNGGDIDLSGDSDVGFAVNTSGNVTVNSAGAVTGNGDQTAGSLGITAGTSIDLQDSSFSDIGSIRYLTAHDGYVSVNLHGDIKLDGNITAGDTDFNYVASLISSGSLLQNSGTITGDAIWLEAGSDITQDGAAAVHGNALSLTSIGRASLGGANDFTTLTDLAVGGDLTLRNLGNINLSPILGGTGGYRSGGALTLVSDTGNILTTNSGIDTSRLTVSAAGSISLDGTIASLGSIAAGQSILLTTYNGSMDLTGNVTGRNISLYADTGLSQSGGIIDADRLNVITNGNITLSRANQIDVVGRLDTDQFDSGTGHDITLRNVGAIVLDYQIEAPGGTVTLTSDTGGISQTGFSNLFTAGTLNATAAGAILLDYAGNNVGRVTGLRTSSGNISFNEADGFDIYGDISTPGSVSFGSGGAIETYTGHLSAGTLSVTAGGEVSLNAIGNIKLGAADTSGAGVTSGGNFFLTTDGDIELTGAVTTGDRNLILDTTGGAITTNGGTVSANYNGSSGVIYATAKGGIDLVSAGNAVIWATSANGGDINLTGDSDIGFMANTTGDLTVTAGGWAGNNSDVIARSVAISAGTAITLNDQTVNIDVGSYRYLTVADGYIDIENQGDINLDGNVTASGGNNGNWVRLNSSQNSILQNSGTISGYSVELDAARSVTQDINARIVTGDYGLSFSGTDVTLVGANEFPWINTYTVSRDLTLRAVGTLDMSGNANQATGGRNVTLISDTGNIIGGYVDADKLSATALNGSLSFTYGNNRIRGLGDLTAKSTSGNDINIFTDSTLGLTGNITGGGVILHATQGINQTAGAITADRLAAGTSGSLLLGGANNFGMLTEVGHGNGTTVTIRNLGSILLPSTPTTFGTLTLTSDTGSIGQTDAITVARLIANAATGITLNVAGNNFTTLGGLTTAAGDIRIADTGGFAIEGNIAAPGTAALASTGNITTGTTTVGSVTTPHGKVDADTLTVSAVNATVYTAGDIKLGASAVSSGFTLIADGNIDVTGVSSLNLASLSAAAGSITQSAGGALTGNSVLTAAGGSITLDKNNSLADFGGTSYGGGTITFNNLSPSALTLSLSTTGNAVVTTAGDVLGAYIHASDLSLTAGSIDLRTQVGVNSFSKLVASYGDVLVTNTGSFTVTGDVSASTVGIRSVNLQANGGGISQTAGTISANDVTLRGSGDLIQSGTGRVVTNVVSLAGANILFGGGNNFASGNIAAGGSLTLRNAGSIDLDALGGYSNGGSTLTLTSDNGSITSHDVVVTTALSALAANGNVTFDNASNAILRIDGLRAQGTGTVYTNSPLFLNGSLEAGTVLTLRSQGGIIRLGGALKAASLYVTNGGSGSITLNGDNDVDTLVALTAAGDVSFRDIDGFQIDGNVSGDRVSLTADAGSIYEKNGSTLTANHLTASAIDGLQLNQVGNSIQYIDGLTLSGASGASLGIASGGGDMHLAGEVAAAGQYVTFYVAGGSLVQDSGTITAGNLGITVPDGSATLGANAISNLGSINVRDNFTANSDLSTGVLGLAGNIVVGGTTTITNSAGIAQGPAGSINTYNLNLITAGTLDMGNVINVVGGQANIEMGSGAFLSYLDLNLRLNATGAATITSYGNITFTGAGSSSADTLTLSAANGIYSGAGAGGQVAANHLGTVANSGSGGVALNLLGNVTLEGDVTAAGQTVSITAEDGLGQATGAVITAGRLDVTTTGANASILLDNANAVGTFGLNVTGDATLRSTLATTIAPGVTVGGSLTVHSDSDITVGGGTVGGTLALYSSGGVNSTGHIGANRLTGSADSYFFLDLNSLNYLDTIESGDVVEISASGNLNIVGDITAAGGIEISGTTLNHSAGTITTGADDSIGLSASGAITQTGGRIIAKSISANTGGDISLLGANQAGVTGNYLRSGGTSIAFRNEGSIEANSDFSFFSGRGALTLISDTGSITQAAAVDATRVTLTAATGIDFSNAANTIDAIGGLSNSTSGGISLVTSGNLVLDGSVTAMDQAVSFASVSGGVSQTTLGTIAAESLGVSAQAGVQLHAANNIREVTGLSNAGSGGISFNNLLAYEISGNVTAAGQQVTLDSTYGGVAQSGGIITADNVISSSYGLIRLDRANNVGSTTASSFSSSVGNISFRSANAILLGTVNAPGLLSLTSDSGGITQTVAISAASLSATSLDGDIVLDQANAIGAVNDVATDGSFTLAANANLTLDGTITAPDLVKLTAAGNLTQIGTGAIHSALLQATSGAGATAGISLLNHNDVDQALLNSNGKDLRFRNTGDFALGDINAAGHIVEMISDGGAVTQQAGTSILAGTFSATGTDVVLDNSGNQISRIGLISTGSDLNLRNGVALQIDRIDAAGHAVTINNGDNLTGGNITADKLTVNLTGGYVDLTTANHVASLGGFNGYQFSFTNDESFTISGAIQNGMYQSFLTSVNGSISMAAGGAVNSAAITAHAATGISLTGSMSYVYGATTTTGDVTLNSWLLDIQGDISGDTVTLGGLANGGFVRQTSGSITANLLNGGSYGDFDLNGATNHIAALGALNSGGHINIASLDAVTLTGNIDTGDTLTLNAGGAVNQAGGRIKGYWLNVTAAGDIDLGAANLIDGGGSIRLFGDNVTFVNDGTFTIDQINAGSHAIDLTSTNGNIWQSSVMVGGSITASAHGLLSLNQANAIDTIGKLSAGTELTYNSSAAYTLTDDVTAGTTVALNGAAGIVQAGGTISGQSLAVAAGSADLRQANIVGRLGAITTAGDFLFRNVGDIELWGSSNSSVGGKFGLYSDTGGVSNPGALFTADIVDVTAAGDIDMNGGSFNYIDRLASQNGDITVITTSNILGGNLISAPGTVDLTVGRITADSVKANQLNVDATGSDIELVGDNDIARLGYLFGDNISLAVGQTAITGYINASNSIAFVRSGLATDFALASAGGALRARMISISNTGSAGTATLGNITTPSSALELNFNFNGNASVTAASSAIYLNNVVVDGDLALRADGAITASGAHADISGTISARNNSGDISLNFGSDTIGHFGDILAGGYVGLGAASVDLTGAVESGGGVAVFAANGSVTQASGATITAATIEGMAAGDLRLGSNNAIGTINGLAAGGDLTFKTSGALQIARALTAGTTSTMTLTAGGDINVTGADPISGGTLSVFTSGHWANFYNTPTSPRTISFTALGDVNASNFQLYNNGSIDLTGNIVVAMGAVIDAGGQITQSAGALTAGLLTLNGYGVAVDRQNHVGTLLGSAYSGTGFSFTNAQDLRLNINPGYGDVTLTVDGDLTANGGISTLGNITLTANGVQASELWGNSVTVNGGAHDLNIGDIVTSDDVSVTATGNVTIGSLYRYSENDMAGDGFNALISGGDVTLGAASGSIASANFVDYSVGGTPGSVTIQATGNATLGVADMYNAAVNITAAGNVNAESTNDLLLGTVSGANVTLLAGTNLSATSVTVPGTYSVTARDIDSGAFNILGGNPLDIIVTDTGGDLSLAGNLVARRNTTITAQAGNVLGSTAHLGAGTTMDGTLTVNGANITLAEASSLYDLVFNATGTVDVGLAYVGRDYTLRGNSFQNAALAPIGNRTGIWTLTSLGALDLGASTLEYNGGIDFHVSGLLGNGTIHSVNGAVTGDASAIDIYELLAGTDIDATAIVGGLTVFHAVADTGSATLRSNQALTVTTGVEAGTDVGLSAQFGAATAGYASAGGDISVYSLSGNAILRQATLTGATGDLTVQSTIGSATLGADDSASIGVDNYFGRAARSTGTVSVLGSTGGYVNLDRSAALDLVQANSAAVHVSNGDLTIGMLQAQTGAANAYLGDGSMTVNAASGATVDLAAWGGDLTLGGGGINAGDLYLTSDGRIDTTAIATLSAGHYLYIEGGSVRAASLSSGGNAEVHGDTGGITIDEIGANGDLAIGASGNLAINQVSVTGYADLETNGAATVRDLTASNGFALAAQGDIMLGADAEDIATTSNAVVTNGTLGAGCGCTGGWIVSAGGNISINLFSVTGVLDRVSADTGDVAIALVTGDLGINTLRGHDIGVSTPGQVTVTDAHSSGGSYALTAADFGGFALGPTLFGGATSLGDVTIIDTAGNLNSTGSLASSGDIHIEAQDGAITGGLVLAADGDVTAIGQGVDLQWVAGRDVTIDAGTGTAGISNTLQVGRTYTLTAGDFSGNILVSTGANAGSLGITDTAGDFDFGSADLAFGGAISIDASHGSLNIGNVQAGSAITLDAGGNLSLASAKLIGTGTNALSLTASGDMQFGAANAASITGGNVFSHAGPTLTGTSIHADGNVAINLYQAGGFGAIEGGTVQITAVTGDFSAGNIDAVGALSVQGPSGTLTLGNLTTSAGHINVSGQGDTTLGNVFGRFVIALGASAGNLSVGTVTGGDVSFLAAGGINATGVSASALGVVAVNGDVDFDHGGAGSNVASLGTVTVNNGGFRLRNLRDLGLDGVIEVNGTLDLQVGGALTQNAFSIVADRLQGSATGAAVLGGDNRIDALGIFSSNGLRLNNITGLVIDGAVQAGGGTAVIASHGGMTIAANGSVSASAAGDAITLASDGLFTNLAGASALSAANGRWLVYTQVGGSPGHSDPNNDFGGLAGTSYYGDAYNFGTGGFASAPNAGNRFVYGYRPVLTVTPSSLHLIYDGTTPTVTATVTGLVNGDSGANAWSGAAEISGVGPNAGIYFAYSALGTLSSEMGYSFAFVPGTVIIDPRVISVVLNANDRTYDGTTNASGTLTLNGVIAGDTVTANAASMIFDSRNAGTRTVTAGGITLSGASAGNYAVSATTTDLADILARAITATLTANDRTYDGTTNATGTLGLNGVIGGDDVSVNGATLVFDSKNAGTRTVTASGITLTGADAGNYVVTANATDLADILARAITATLTANDRIYDGTTAATGTLGLSGVLGNDQVTANGTLSFDSRNAGTGRTVTASGIGLSGADAGNYVVNASATDLADILARAITATLTANDRTYDGTTNATGTFGLSGVVAGDTVSAGAGSMVFDNGNAGTGRTVTASGITLTGADASNYTVNASATDLADILARAITATLSANGRVYDGTTIATGTLALNGVLSGDQVTVSAGGITFDSRNAGTRTATASGLTLGGANAGNYTITGTATGSAVISPRAITAAATADSRVYDGTTAATGRIALSGVISGDTVTGTATYRFADANAGTGRAVQVSGLALSGADAANYTVSLSATPVTADITRRLVTVTINDATKLLGQPDPVFGYAVSSGSVVNGDSFTGAPIRAAGDQAGRYAIGQGTLALSANYALTVVPGTLVISLTQSGAEASDALKMLQDGVGIRFSVNQDPSRNLEGDGDQDSEGDGAR